MSTACGHRIAHRKWKESKLQPGTAGPGNMLGCCLVSFHFLWAILCPQAVQCDIHHIHSVHTFPRRLSKKPRQEETSGEQKRVKRPNYEQEQEHCPGRYILYLKSENRARFIITFHKHILLRLACSKTNMERLLTVSGVCRG